MNSLVLNPCRWVARGTAGGGTASSIARGTGRGVVFLFLLLMPRWAPWLVGLVRLTGLVTALALGAARRAAVRDPCETLRTVPADPFLTVLFFKRWRVFPATAYAWIITLPDTVPRK